MPPDTIFNSIILFYNKNLKKFEKNGKTGKPENRNTVISSIYRTTVGQITVFDLDVDWTGVKCFHFLCTQVD